MDDPLEQARKAAESARNVMDPHTIPADKEGVVSLPVREAMRRIIDSSDITVVWDGDHYHEGVTAAKIVAQEAFLQSRGGRGKKLFGVELWEDAAPFERFMNTGRQAELAEHWRDDRGGLARHFPTNVEINATLKHLERGQYTGQIKTQSIDVFPYDDRSRIYTDTKERELTPGLAKLKTENPEAFSREVERLLVPDRNELMAAKIHDRLRNGAYDTAMIVAGAGHTEFAPKDDIHRPDLDEMLEKDDKTGQRYRVKSVAVSYNNEMPPGIYKNRQVELNLGSEKERKKRTISDVPDIWINYLPFVTAEQFDARVQPLSIGTRSEVMNTLNAWRDKNDSKIEAFHKKLWIGGTKPPSLQEFISDYWLMRNDIDAWDFEGAQKKIKAFHEKHGDFKDGHEGFKSIRGESMADAYVKSMRAGLDDASRTLDSIQERIAQDKKSQQKLPPAAERNAPQR